MTRRGALPPLLEGDAAAEWPRSEWVALVTTPQARRLIPNPVHRYVLLVMVLRLITSPNGARALDLRSLGISTGLRADAVLAAVRESVRVGVLIRIPRGQRPALYQFNPERLIEGDLPLPTDEAAEVIP